MERPLINPSGIANFYGAAAADGAVLDDNNLD